jgi:hypothetical protein
MQKNIQDKITHLLRCNRVMDLTSLQKNLDGRSKRSLFRDLLHLDYFSSYSHAGSFYTLKSTPAFDSNGLWRFNEIGFSKHGSLRDTIIYFINESKTGMKHLDLKDRLQIPVYNTLLALVRSNEISRVDLNGSFLYVNKDTSISRIQIERLEKKLILKTESQLKNIPTWMAIEVLSEVIRESQVTAEPLKIAARLSLRGLKISFDEVKQILEFYEVKKNLLMK